MDQRLIGDILRDVGDITERDLELALAYQRENGGLIGQALLRLGAVDEAVLLSYLSVQIGLPVADLSHFAKSAEGQIPIEIAQNLSRDWLINQDVIINFHHITQDNITEMRVLARNPLNPKLREMLQRYWHGPITYYLCPNRILDSQLLLHKADHIIYDGYDDVEDTQRLREMAEEAPVIDFVSTMFADALNAGASDIHIEPFEHNFQIRMRIDGVLSLAQTLPKIRFDAIASRIKLISGMDIAERRLPQDGRQSVRFSAQDIDLRVSSLPGAWGESLVLRLLRKQMELPSLAALGMEGGASDRFNRLLQNPNGVILVTGPTGSGKSTTLYRAIEQINNGARKIITIEDPVEYDMGGVTQVQVHAEIGYSFAKGLRAILRQDPDIIMIGEIRDDETASIAMQAALTGHLVFSTLHTNSALAAIERLADLEVEPFLMSAALRGVIGQRLVRKLCPDCAVPAHSETVEMAEGLIHAANKAAGEAAGILNMNAPAQWMEAVGCAKCHGQGYLGRIGIFETAIIDESMRQSILTGGSQAHLLAAARAQGYLTMHEAGLVAAYQGKTSIAEIIRVLGETDASA